jgi:hypothetical protein
LLKQLEQMVEQVEWAVMAELVEMEVLAQLAEAQMVGRVESDKIAEQVGMVGMVE